MTRRDRLKNGSRLREDSTSLGAGVNVDALGQMRLIENFVIKDAPY